MYGGQSWLARWAGDFFFPFGCCQAAVLQEGVGDHRHQRMAVKPLPASTLEVIKADLLFELLEPAPEICTGG